MAKLWQGVLGVGHAIGLVVNFLILGVFYFLIFGPFALLARLFARDPLDLARDGRESFWSPREPEEPSLERARRQS
ncbi:MAG: SxtJ family membrane protein [Planctomycetota bacterium]